MSETYEFYVTLGTTDDVEDEETAAELLQWMLNNASSKYVNYVTVQHSEMDEGEGQRLLEMLNRFSDEELEKAIESLEPITDDDS